MKKRLLSVGLIALLTIGSLGLMTGCGSKAPYSGYDFSEYVKLGEYKGLEYNKISVSVSEDEIQDEIQKRCEANSTKKSVKEGTVEEGDTVNISYKGMIDGKAFKGGTRDSDDLTIGSGAMIDGFEDGLVGKSVGETVTLNLKFPEDYREESLAGKDTVFEVKIKTKQVEEVPEYDLDFVKKYYSKYDNLEDFEASVKQDLLDAKEAKEEVAVKNALWTKIIDKCEVIAYPKEKDELYESTMDAYREAPERYDLEWEEYLKNMGVTEDELKERTEKWAENTVFQEMVLYAIAEKEGLEVTEEEYQEFLDNLLKQSGMDKDTFKSTYGMTIEEFSEEKGFRTSILLEKVMDKIIEYGKEVK